MSLPVNERLAQALIRLETNEDFKTLMEVLAEDHAHTQAQLRTVSAAEVLSFRGAEAKLYEIRQLPIRAREFFNRRK